MAGEAEAAEVEAAGGEGDEGSHDAFVEMCVLFAICAFVRI